MITEIQVFEFSKWNEAVKAISGYDVFYLNEYVRAFMNEDETNGVPVLICYDNLDNHAINVVFKRDVAKDSRFAGKIKEQQYYDLISPYGYGGFIGSISDYEALNFAYNEYCTSKGYICEFVRFNLFSSYSEYYDGEIESRTHNVVRMLDMPIDEMWMDFKQKVRKNVKKAQSSGLECIVDTDGTYLDDFLRIYYGTMKRTEAEKSFFFSKEFFNTLITMKDHFSFFHVVSSGKIISSELVLCGSENCYSYLGGTDQDYFELRPNDFLKYEIIRWAKENGFKAFVLGGGYGADDGIFQYKTCLAPRGVVDFFIGRKIFDEQKYKELVQIRSDISSDAGSGFFPAYRR